jgi:hypothetical protein
MRRILAGACVALSLAPAAYAQDWSLPGDRETLKRDAAISSRPSKARRARAPGWRAAA